MPVMMVSGCTVLLFALVVVRLDALVVHPSAGVSLRAWKPPAAHSPRASPLSPRCAIGVPAQREASEEDDGSVGDEADGGVVEKEIGNANLLGQTLEALQQLRPRKQQQPLSPGDRAEDGEPFAADTAKPTGQLIVVSNRLPFSVKPGDAGYQFVMSSGGLVSAMLGVINDDSMTWVGWPGISADTEEEQAQIRSQLDEYRCAPVFLSEEVADTYYNGFCNSVLWPLFHYVQDVLDTNPIKAQWDAYKAANEAFCAEILPRCQPGDTVWVHDYHLMLLPTMLKSRMPSLRVGWFLHTPFPTSEVFRMLPMRDELMRGLAGADLLGFHTDQYVSHFLSAAQRTLQDEGCATSLSASAISCQIPRVAFERVDALADGTTAADAKAEPAAAEAAAAAGADSVEAAGDAAPAGDAAATFAHTAHVASFPIGINPERFLDEMKKGPTQDAIRQLQERFGGRKLMLGIDRLDPIKGIPHKLLAFERLLETHPEYIGEVCLVQIAVPSRLDVDLHQRLQSRLHSLVGRINGKYGTLGTLPIHYLDTSVSFSELVALYAASSAMVITSLRDGMNLVSFEWTVCQQHKPRPWNAGDAGSREGVLVLSEFAGAAEHLDDGAILINPYDTNALAEAMHEALSMPLPRRQALHKAAYQHVTTSTAGTWADKFVSALSRLHASNGLLPDASANRNGLLSLLATHPRLALLTDYDGTLTPIVNDPEAALLSEEMREQLARLASALPTAIVSGRSAGKINTFVGLDDLWVAGAHGFDIRGPKGSGVEHRPAESYADALKAAAAELRLTLAAIPGSLVEDNDYAVSVHYRNVADADCAALDAAVDAALDGQPGLTRFPGKMVVELRPALEWNKGKAVEYILDRLEADAGGPVFPIYLGDDVSDEDAFKVLRKRGGLGILVSEGMVSREMTAATYKLRNPKEVLKLFRQLPPAADGDVA